MDVSYLILGNGIAGHAAAKEIRKRDKEGSIVIVTKEKRNTYFRIKLTEFIGSGYDEDKIYVNKPEWFEENRVKVLLDTEVASFDGKTKTATLANGETYKGEKVLIALGSSPFVPPIKGVDLPGVFAMRTMDDLDAFRSYTEDKKDVTVIGGGLLGLEAAYSLLRGEKNVTVVESFDYVLGRQLNRELGMNLNRELEEMGIHVRAGKNTDAFVGNGKVEKVVLADGTEIKADAVLLSTGVRPNLGTLKDSGVEINRGVVVNPFLETNLEGVYAAGDVAEINGAPMGLWTAAMEMGKIAGANMVDGKVMEYEQPKLFTNLEIGDISIFSCGDVSNYDEMYRYDEEGNHHRIFVEQNKIVGCILEGDTKEKNKMKKMVFSHSDINELNAEHPLFHK